MKSPIRTRHHASPDSLVAQARAGSFEALDTLIDLLVNQYFAELGGRTMPGMSPANTISDLIQETVLRARERFDVFDKTTFAEFKRWADGILRNKYRHWMRNHRDRTRETVQMTIWRAIQMRRNLPDPNQSQRAEDDAIVLREAAARAYDVFEQQLKPSDQYVIKLRLLEELRFKQIALLVNSSEDAVRKAYNRALSRLKTLVAAHGKP